MRQVGTINQRRASGPKLRTRCAGRSSPGLYQALDLDRAPALEPVAVPQPPVGRLGDLLAHGQGQVGHRLGVVGPGVGQAAGDHVGVADGLDLLQPLVPGQLAERREQMPAGGRVRPLGRSVPTPARCCGSSARPTAASWSPFTPLGWLTASAGAGPACRSARARRRVSGHGRARHPPRLPDLRPPLRPARRPGPQAPLLLRRLHAKAALTGFPEADACRAKADQLRAKYGL